MTTNCNRLMAQSGHTGLAVLPAADGGSISPLVDQTRNIRAIESFASKLPLSSLHFVAHAILS